MVSLGLEFGSGLAVLFWFRVSQEAVVKMQQGLQSLEGLTRTKEFPSEMIPSHAIVMWPHQRAVCVSS